MNLGQFDEYQQSVMLWAKDPETGKRLKLTPTDELMTNFAAWHATECAHEDKGLVAIKARGGALMYRRQCLICGDPETQWISRSTLGSLDSIPLVLGDLKEQFEKTRLIAWQSIQERHAKVQLASSDTEYATYLASETWRAKRAKVFDRANGLCEGCREQPATQVHHLTYKHIQEEFLWELVAICDGCHGRVHNEQPQ